MTSWLPRREPKVFQSTCSTPCSLRYRAAGPFLGIEPAGEMWSVVTESPSTASTRAPVMSRSGARLRRQVPEERRLLDVGGIRVPGVPAPLGNLERPPGLVPLEDRRVAAVEQFGLQRPGHRVHAPPPASARCRAGTPGGRPCRSPAAPGRGRCPLGPPARTRRPESARRDSWREPADAPAPRSSDSRSRPRRRPASGPRSAGPRLPAADRCCRYRWCSRSPPR